MPAGRARIAQAVGIVGELVGQRLQGGERRGGVAGLALGRGRAAARARGGRPPGPASRLAASAGLPASSWASARLRRTSRSMPWGWLASSGCSTATAPGPSFFCTRRLAAQQPDGGSISGCPLSSSAASSGRSSCQGQRGGHQPGLRVRGVAQGPGAEHRVGLHHLPLAGRQHPQLAGRGRGRLLEHGAGEVDPRLVGAPRGPARPGRHCRALRAARPRRRRAA